MPTVKDAKSVQEGLAAPQSGLEKTRKLSVLRNVLEPLAHTATAIGIFVAIYQFVEARQDRRIDAILDLAARFDDDQVQVGKSKRLLEQQWWAYEHELERLRSVTADGSMAGPQLEAFVSQVILDQSGTERGKMRAAVGDVTGYFDQIGLCVSENRCDQRLAADYFCGYALNFHQLFSPTILNIRKNFGNAALGRNFEMFLETQCEELKI